jgi:hypothetical protein
MSDPRSFLRAAPGSVTTDPALFEEMTKHVQTLDGAEAVINERITLFESIAPFSEEIDPRDAYFLKLLAYRASILEGRVRDRELDPEAQVSQRYTNAQNFFKAQPDSVKEFVRGRTIDDIRADVERLETVEIPRLQAEYERLLKQNESIRQTLFKIPAM